jgi:DNA repair protein SbcC/Rad50
MISSIELKNWRSHLDTVMDFSDGTNVLIGIVGAGKTSILDGLCFGLFGTFPTLMSKKIKLEDVIMKKPHKKEKAEIVVNFVLGDNKYSVKRMIEKGKTSAEFRKNGKLIEAPQTQRVTEEVEKVLRINYDLFTRAVYSEQNQIDMFLTIPKGQRMKKIDELLSIDKFEVVRKNTVVLINKFFALSNEKKKIIDGLQAGSSMDINKTKDDLNKLSNELGRVESKLVSIKDNKKIQEVKLSDLKRIDKRIRDINQEEKICIATIQAYKADIDNLTDLIAIAEKSDSEFLENIDELETKMINGNKSLEDDRIRLTSIRKSISSKETEIKIISEQRIPKIKKDLEDKESISRKLKRNGPEKINEKIENKLIDLDTIKEKLNRQEMRIEETEETLKQMEDIEKRCPLCDQNMTEKKKSQIINLKKARIARAIKLKEGFFKDVIKINKDVITLRLKLKEVERFETQLLGMGNLEEELVISENVLTGLKSEIKNLLNEEKMLDKNVSLLEKKINEDRTELEKLKSVYEKKQELMHKTRKIEESQAKISVLEKERDSFVGFYSDIIPSIENELMEVYGMEKGLEAKIEGLHIMIKEKERESDEMEKRKKIIEGYEIDSKKFDSIAEQLRLFETSVKLTQDQLRKNFINAVNQATDEVWNQIYPYNDFYSCRLGVDGDYTLQLLDDTGWINVDGIASGGERSIACLALRIAFSLVLAPQLRWLVMDEPTHNLDSKTVEDFSALLRERLPNMIDQVFIITHDPALEGAVSGHLYRLERNKGNNEPTRAVHMNKE